MNTTFSVVSPFGAFRSPELSPRRFLTSVAILFLRSGTGSQTDTHQN
jgi:hypothetical protein